MKNADRSVYPVDIKVDLPQDYRGLTKRELFAAMAMQALCSLSYEDTERYELTYAKLSRVAKDHADALLIELDKTNG